MSFELRIESLAFGGRGLGRHDGQAVFVPFSAPGDLLRCRTVQRHKRYQQAEIVELLEASPLRVAPRCPLFGSCGGCQWQHMPYAEQLHWKQQLHAEQLRRNAGLEAPETLTTLPAEPEWEYRSRAQFKCYLGDDGLVLGFYRTGSHYVIDLDNCPVCHPRINALLPALKENLSASPDPGRIPQVDVSTGDDGGLRCVVHYIGTQAETMERHLAGFAREQGVAMLMQSGRKSSLRLLHGDPLLHVEPRMGMPLAYRAGGFAQVHLEQNRRLVELVVNVAGPNKGRVLDLYCGMGNFTLPLAMHGRRVTGIESYAPSIEQARENAARHAIGNVQFEVADGAAGLARVWGKEGFSCVVLDPPRNGAREACLALARLKPVRIVYVSCDSSTLARDLKVLLQHGYRLQSSQPIDMFPHTAHIESVTILTLPGI